jgi:transposase
VALDEEGWPEVLIAEALDVNKGTVSRWLAIAKASGVEALLGHTGAGHPAKLTPEQLVMVPEFVWHGAEAYGFRGDVWTCPRIAQVIRWEFGISYHKDHVSRLMKELGWTPQIPITRAVQRDEAAIEHWRVDVWPQLRRRAVRERRTLVFIDESGFYLLPGKVKTYGPKGKTPVLDKWLTRDHLSVMAGFTPAGKVYTLVRPESLSSTHSVVFLGVRRGDDCWSFGTVPPFIAGKLCANGWPTAERGGFTWNSCLATRLTSIHWMQEAGII